MTFVVRFNVVDANYEQRCYRVAFHAHLGLAGVPTIGKSVAI